MTLKELLELLDTGWFKVVDLDTELQTDMLGTGSIDSSQLKTLRDKKVKGIRLYGGSFMEIEVKLR